jgi:hypothetical protein
MCGIARLSTRGSRCSTIMGFRGSRVQIPPSRFSNVKRRRLFCLRRFFTSGRLVEFWSSFGGFAYATPLSWSFRVSLITANTDSSSAPISSSETLVCRMCCRLWCSSVSEMAESLGQCYGLAGVFTCSAIDVCDVRTWPSPTENSPPIV